MKIHNNPYREARHDVKETLGYWAPWLTVDEFARVSGYMPVLVESWCVSDEIPCKKNDDGEFLINYRQLVYL